MKKIISIILLICMSLAVFAACDSFSWGPFPEDAALKGDVVGENGGMAVQKGGYLYFVNGMIENSDPLRNNEFGKVIKGSICRMPVADLAKSTEQERNTNIKIIVPKVIVANYTDGGFYIYGDYIYYTTPNSERGSSGGTQYTWVDFMKTKVDGTGTTRLAKINPETNGGTIPFKFIKSSGGAVYLVYYSQETLYKLNASSAGKAVEISDNVSGYTFGEKEVFYTRIEKTKNQQGDEETEDYNTVWSADPSQSPVEITATLVGTTAELYNERDKKEKYTFAVNSYQKGILFYTRTLDFGGINTDNRIWGYKADEATNKIKPFTGHATTAQFFAVGWNEGLVTYTGSRFDRYPGSTNPTEYTETPYNLFIPEESGYTMYFLDGNNLFFGVASGAGEQVWYFDITEGTSDKPMNSSLAKRVTLNAALTGWLKPKLIDGKLFFINAGGFSGSDGDTFNDHLDNGFINYTYFVDITKPLPDATADDDELAEEVNKEVWVGKHDSKDENED